MNFDAENRMLDKGLILNKMVIVYQRNLKSVIRISKAGADRLIITFPYNPIFVKKVKGIKGRKWHPEGKYRLPAASLWQAGSFPSNKFLGKIKSPLDALNLKKRSEK